MSRTLADARAALVAAMKRETTPTELPRLVAVLDALIAWSVARPELLAFRAEAGRSPTQSPEVSFERAGAKAGAVFWSARVTRGEGAKLEIHSPAGRALSAEDRAWVMETLNVHSRAALVRGDRLRIGFPALKNAAARAAVLALMDRLLAGEGRPETE